MQGGGHAKEAIRGIHEPAGGGGGGGVRLSNAEGVAIQGEAEGDVRPHPCRGAP